MHGCIDACMHTCIHAYVHTCIHAYAHTCIHAYVHTFCFAARLLQTLFRRHENLSGVNLSLAAYPQNTCKSQNGPSRIKCTSFAGVLLVFCRCFAGVLMALCVLMVFCWRQVCSRQVFTPSTAPGSTRRGEQALAIIFGGTTCSMLLVQWRRLCFLHFSSCRRS